MTPVAMGQPAGQGLVVAQVLVLAGQLPHARIRAVPLIGGKAGGIRLGGDLRGHPGAVPGQHRKCRCANARRWPASFPGYGKVTANMGLACGRFLIGAGC